MWLVCVLLSNDSTNLNYFLNPSCYARRNKHDIVKTQRVPEHANPTRNGQRTDSLPLDQRIVKKLERKDQQVSTERVDVQRRNWRNENWRNNRDTGRQQQRQKKERQPSPETWRKPVEQPKSASPDTGLRYGKIASALELAQAFSRSFSDRKLADRCSGERSLPSNMRMPFSRLMAPTSRPQINASSSILFGGIQYPLRNALLGVKPATTRIGGISDGKGKGD
ncbi:unnamed protein product [Dovyalis caffra]|uniref:Uncharacterized protein n=1 Tax=Dovyalis caffra TaxID=77055 RepID=A0AAV1SK93_9ROSI|nr:unnamed protein product [Dovyalis caffra]